jgi:hypothetical protein
LPLVGHKRVGRQLDQTWLLCGKSFLDAQSFVFGAATLCGAPETPVERLLIQVI